MKYISSIIGALVLLTIAASAQVFMQTLESISIPEKVNTSIGTFKVTG